jgi:hypothetical protein
MLWVLQEEMEGLLLAVREMAIMGPAGLFEEAQPPAATSQEAAADATAAEVSQVKALLARLEAAGCVQQQESEQQQHSPSLWHGHNEQGGQQANEQGQQTHHSSSSSSEVAAGRLLASEAAANRHRKEFSQVRWREGGTAMITAQPGRSKVNAVLLWMTYTSDLIYFDKGP